MGQPIEFQQPGVAIDVDLATLVVRRINGRCLPRGAAEQQGVGIVLLAIVDMHGHRQAISALPVAENAGHQIVHAVGAVGPAQQGRAALLDGVNGQPHSVHWRVDQKTGLHILVGFLNQQDLGGDGRTVAVAGLLHGQAPHRFGVHVVAKCPQVAIAEWLQVDDRGVEGPLPLGPHPVIAKALGADGSDMVLQLVGLNQQGEANPLYAGNIGVNTQLVHIGAPLLATDVLRASEESSGAIQGKAVEMQALFDLQGDLIGGKG